MKAIFLSVSFGIAVSLLPLARVQAQVPLWANPTPDEASGAIDDRYILGPGDRLFLTFFNVPEYNGEQQVLVDGSINLPIIGPLSVSGLALEDASGVIESAYSHYLRTPLVTVDLITPRSLRVGISGEVNRPGSYDIPLVNRDNNDVIEWPTVIKVIQLSGGITDKANVRSVEIRRPQPFFGEQVIQVNVWDILTTGSIQSDITLRHGDAIHVPTATALRPDELTQLSAANFSPDSIRVTVVGEVSAPGAVDISPNAPLNQALLAAGGFDPRRAKTDEVQLVRLNPDGTVSQRTISVAFDQGINEESNPALRNNDVVLVGRSARAAFADEVAEGVFRPLGSILSPFQLLFNIFD